MGRTVLANGDLGGYCAPRRFYLLDWLPPDCRRLYAVSPGSLLLLLVLLGPINDVLLRIKFFISPRRRCIPERTATTQTGRTGERKAVGKRHIRLDEDAALGT